MSQFGQPVPPISSDFQPMAELPVWPKVIGIISIIWGSLGILCNTCAALGSLITPVFVNMVPPEQREEMQKQLAASMGLATVVVAVFGALIAILLIIAGIQTLKRQPAGRMLHLIYGVLGCLIALIGTAIGWSNSQAQIAGMPPEAANVARMGNLFGLAIGVCVGIAYPIFCLVWFGLVKRNSSDMGVADQEPVL